MGRLFLLERKLNFWKPDKRYDIIRMQSDVRKSERIFICVSNQADGCSFAGGFLKILKENPAGFMNPKRWWKTIPGGLFSISRCSGCQSHHPGRFNLNGERQNAGLLFTHKLKCLIKRLFHLRLHSCWLLMARPSVRILKMD